MPNDDPDQPRASDLAATDPPTPPESATPSECADPLLPITENSAITEDGKSEGSKDGPEKRLPLPDWFLRNNVILAEDECAQASPADSEDADSKDADGSKNAPDGKDPADGSGPKGEDGNSVGRVESARDVVVLDADYDMHRGLYSETRDTILSGIVRDQVTDGPSSTWINTTAFLVQSPKKGALRFLDAVVQHLSRDLGADLVTLDLEDLDELCHHFLPDSPAESEQDVHLPRRFITKYFKTSEEPATEIIDAILGASEEKKATNVSATLSTQQRPLIIHLQDVEGIARRSLESPHILKQIREAVKRQRGEAKATVIVATAVSDSTRETQNRTHAMDRVWDNLCFGYGAVVNISPSRSKKVADALERDAKKGCRRTAFRQLRRTLRSLLEPQLQSELLSPIAKWEPPESQSREEIVYAWSDETFSRISRQICARVRAKSELILDDVFEVLARVSNNVSIFKECNTDYTPADEKAAKDKEKKPEKKSKLQELLDNIEASCTDEEKKFLDCVVDTDRLPSTSESIQIDQETMGSLRQLLALRVNKSYGLLAAETINGAILYGPPGTGKTHLARVVAKESAGHLIVATPADIESCWVGQTEKRIKALFSFAAKLSPCVIFLDEADAMFRRRTLGDRNYERKALSQFLTEMEGLRHLEKPPFTLVATNRPGDLDDAICRRLPHTLHVGLPEAEDRKCILNINLREEQVAEDVDVNAIAKFKTRGFSGSDIRTLCIQAAMIAQRELEQAPQPMTDETSDAPVKRVITKAHFDRALQKTRPSVTMEALEEIQKFTNRRAAASTRE